MVLEFAKLIRKFYLDEYAEYFERDPFGLIFVTPADRRKSIFEWPDIAKELGVADDAPAEPPPA